ncbi:hypothetical protein OG887_26390 [Streptomyces sp. NBC_00053]|uniref:hypothetical protein n=1 Tax=unclassified Streptomyces TaxID=2593676 RepID=UPI002252DF7D|nr:MULTISPECIES: hypothetical protein [unclassified Streptomyces]WSG53070.1 hypothetical protein OHA38_26630 [Streptomyces sp. NBC_01732]WSX03713.1 hypothetical protein OG355_26685 [Streptomyces sp. NBC_00987]MCX4394266.1 hypothetical protein [Streptomyces sp. NBC_01767]MCX5106215.1 hypothetical protein [Streptomyces sp. NBC_00439]MCX5162647.1 hypothetical protein [Streptomyces sp. NBC_00305]
MTSARRTARTLAAAAALALTAVLAGCGTERAGAGAGGTTPGANSGPPVRGDSSVDGSDASKYRENHAFQSTAELSPADRAKGDAEVAKVKAALAGIAEGRKATEPRIRAALAGLGHSSGAITTGTFGPHRNTFVLDLGTICVEGSLDGMANGLVTAEAHGKYLEGTGCVKPVGGH